MKIKRLGALALAGTMVFSMAACGDKGEAKTSGGDKVSNEANNVSAETVLEAFAQYSKDDDKNYSADMSMNIDMNVSGMAMKITSTNFASSYDGVTYSKVTSTTNMFGAEESTVDETYTITMEDGTVMCATKSSEDDEWDVYEDFGLDTESDSDINVEELLDSAKIEKKGDNCYVTITMDADEMDLSDDDIMSGIPDAKVDVVLTYNAKEETLTEINVDVDKKIIEEAFGEMFGEVEIAEFSLKIENIKKNDKPIEIPAEIELD